MIKYHTGPVNDFLRTEVVVDIPPEAEDRGWKIKQRPRYSRNHSDLVPCLFRPRGEYPNCALEINAPSQAPEKLAHHKYLVMVAKVAHL